MVSVVLVGHCLLRKNKTSSWRIHPGCASTKRVWREGETWERVDQRRDDGETWERLRLQGVTVKVPNIIEIDCLITELLYRQLHGGRSGSA